VTIKRKFSVGILLTMAITVFSVTTVFTFRNLLFNDSPFLNYLSYRDNLSSFSNQTDLSEIIRQFKDTRKQDFFDYILIDEKSELVWTSLESKEIEPLISLSNSNVEDARFAINIIRTLKDRQFIIESVHNEHLNVQLFFFYYKSIFISDNERFQIIFSLCLITILTLIIVPLVFNILFSRTGHMINDLVKATEKVARGDLDFDFEIQGLDEISRLAKSFDDMRVSLAESKKRQARFLMGVSHDLKTPLTSIDGFLEAIHDGMADDPEKMQNYLNIITEKAKLLGLRIVELIDFVKMETGEWMLKAETLSLNDFLDNLAAVYREESYIYNRNFNFKWQITQDILIRTDPALFNRVLENLLNNAFRYTAETDTIELVCRMHTEDEISIEIRDTGRGIDSEDLKYIFEPMYRGTRTRNEKGFGLGLSIVKSIVEAHKWSIEVSSEPGHYTAFHLYIPRIKPVEPAG